MKLLAIETSSANGGIALLDGENVMGERPLQLSRTASTLLLPAISELFETVAWPLASLDAIAVSIGPGSFTGVRIGVATAQGLASAAGLGVYGVPSLLALAAQATTEDPRIAVVKSAPAGEFFFTAYEGGSMQPAVLAAEGRYQPSYILEMIEKISPLHVVCEGGGFEGLVAEEVGARASALGRVAQGMGPEALCPAGVSLEVRHYAPEYRQI